MAVHYKFKSAKGYDSIPIDGHSISVGHLKEKIFESKQLGRGTDFDLVVTNAQTNEEYLDEAMMISKNTSVLIRRVPGRPRMTIVTQPDVPKEENKPEDFEPAKSSYPGADSAVMNYHDDTDWDEFGNDLYAIPEVQPIQSSNPIQDAPPHNQADEDSKIKALIDTPALDWQRQGSDGFGAGRGFGRGMGGRMMGGRGFGRLGMGMERKTPPQGYICHRCKVPGHFIQHCPTNGDPNYDIKRVKPPTGIPKSMLMATPDGSYALPSGAVAVLRPNEAAFEKEIEGLPSTRPVGDLPPELHCPLCKEVMKDAVLTSKCCFNSFCDKCIRDYIMSRSICVCGATNVLADDLLPNKTLRDTINRILESNNSSGENAGSTYQVQDMESARCPQPKAPSPTISLASKGEQMPPPRDEEISKMQTENEEHAVTAPQQTSEKGKTTKVADVSEATHESMSVKESASQWSAPLAEEEVQQKVTSSEAGKKKKKKKLRPLMNAAEMQWKASQDFAAENFMMPMGPAAYNPYWNGMQPGMEGFVPPYGGPMPYMGYGQGPFDMPFGGMLPPHDPFGQGFMMPLPPPQRDLADFGMGMNPGPPIMSREEFEARKADLRRKRELERRGESSRDFSKDREFSREMSSSVDLKSKSKLAPPSSADHNHHHQHRRRSERPLSPERSSARDLEPPRPPIKRKSSSEHHYYDDRDYHEHQQQQQQKLVRSNHRSESSARQPSLETQPSKSSSSAAAAAAAAAAADRKHKASVFSRISFPEEEALRKKRKLSSSSVADGPPPPPSGNASVSSSHHHHRATSNGYPEYPTTTTTVKAVVSSGGGARKSSSSAAVDYESSDDDRHFKRKPSRYEPSPPPRPVAPSTSDWEEEPRHSRRSSRDRGREYERDRSGYSKHR